MPNTRDAAAAELDQVRKLLVLAGEDDFLRQEIATLLTGVPSGRPMPNAHTLGRRLHSGIPNGSSATLSDYLTWWIDHRQIDENTRISYRSHIQVHLVPHLGHVALDALTSAHIDAMFARMIISNNAVLDARADSEPAVRAAVKGQRIVSPATMARIRATLRKALNDAIGKYRLIDFNPAVYVEIPPHERPTAVLSTTSRTLPACTTFTAWPESSLCTPDSDTPPA